jgi:hypothetical protein
MYKLLRKKIDTNHKTEMRNLIISAPKKFTSQEQKDIMAYCKEDTIHLPDLWDAILERYELFLDSQPQEKPKLMKEMLLRGDYAVRSAMMESLGYPFNYEATKNFSDSVESILSEMARDINSQFINMVPFKFDHTKDRFSQNQKLIRTWIKNSELGEIWPKTDPSKLYPHGQYKIDKKTFEKFFNFSHDFPRGNFGAQVLRYLKTKQHMNGFRFAAGKDKKTFWDYVGSDKRARPFLNIYGSQSARTQPGATGFIPLKAAWIRSTIEAPMGRALASTDYSSEEYLISALLADDEKMIEAYKTGDVYLHFAKESNMVPNDATKKSHPVQRQAAKSCVLGISYGLTEVGLARDLTNATGEVWSEDDARGLINAFYNVYKKYGSWKRKSYDRYKAQGFLKLPCGWYMWGANKNKRSVKNCPVQGFGSSLMRRAVTLLQDRQIDVIYTLHDAVYVEYKSLDWNILDIL